MNNKRKKYNLVILLLLMAFLSGHAQIAVKGPVCVKEGTEYQYIIDGVAAGTASLEVCITGGKIAHTDSSCHKGRPVHFVRIIWGNVNNGNIALSGGTGNASLQVTVTKILSAGNIDSLHRQQIISAGVLPATIVCTAATGGNCSPQYQYQWQQSFDGITWSNAVGASSKDLLFSARPAQNTLYRRMVTETTSHTEAYSDIAIVLVSQ